VPAEDTTVLDLHGYTVIPGIVGMHDHLFYIARPNLDSQWHFDQPDVSPQMTFSPRLYLGCVELMSSLFYGSTSP